MVKCGSVVTAAVGPRGGFYLKIEGDSKTDGAAVGTSLPIMATMFTHACAHKHTRSNTYSHMCSCPCTLTHTCSYRHVHMHTLICTHGHMHARTMLVCTHAHTPMLTHICAHACSSTHMFMCVHVPTCARAHMDTCPHTHMLILAHDHTCPHTQHTCSHTCSQQVNMHIFTCTHVRTHGCEHSCSHTLSHARSHTHSHTHAHTHIIPQQEASNQGRRAHIVSNPKGDSPQSNPRFSWLGEGCQRKPLSFRHKSCHWMWLLLGNSDSHHPTHTPPAFPPWTEA